MVKNSHSEHELGNNAVATLQLRTQADTLLQRLLAGREQSERRFAEAGQRDAIKSITGRSAIENAIATTRSMIDDMDELLEQMNLELNEADLTQAPEPVLAGDIQ